MKRIYEAEHITQAHLLRSLLEQQGIDARVDGEYLQGGIGELGVAGLIGISVADHQVQQAQEILTAFEQEQLSSVELPGDLPENTSQPATSLDSSIGEVSLHPVALAVIGAIVVFLLYQLALLIWAQ